jgi:hypothetical protein
MKSAYLTTAFALTMLLGTNALAEQKPTGEPKQKPASEANIVAIPPANWLFVQTAQSMSFKGTTLTLEGIAHRLSCSPTGLSG